MKVIYSPAELKAAHKYINKKNKLLTEEFDVEKFFWESVQRFIDNEEVSSTGCAGVVLDCHAISDECIQVDVLVTPCFDKYDHIEEEV